MTVTEMIAQLQEIAKEHPNAEVEIKLDRYRGETNHIEWRRSWYAKHGVVMIKEFP